MAEDGGAAPQAFLGAPTTFQIVPTRLFGSSPMLKLVAVEGAAPCANERMKFVDPLGHTAVKIGRGGWNQTRIEAL